VMEREKVQESILTGSKAPLSLSRGLPLVPVRLRADLPAVLPGLRQGGDLSLQALMGA
jgi:hypothetical protein